MTREEFLKTHPLYESFLTEWNYHNRSYLGGRYYREGNYLLQHPFESDTNYARRKETAYFYNYCSPIIDILVSYLYWKSPERTYGKLSTETVPPRKPKTLFDSFWWNVDYEGTSFDQFMRKTQRYAGIYGRVSIIVDKPQIVATSLLEELEMDVRPYLTIVTPENLLDWTYVTISGRPVLESVKIAEEWGGAGPSKVRVWTRSGWELWILNEKKEVILADAGMHALGEVPIVNIYNRRSGTRMIGVSDLQDIADINKNIYYLCSAAKEIIENTAFPMLAMPFDKTGASEVEEVGPKNIIQFDPEQPNSHPFWLEAPHSSLAEIREWIQQDTQEIARIAKMGGLRNTETSTQPWTGVAIRAQMEQLKSSLVEKADNAEQAELDIFNLWAAWQGEKFTGEVKYRKDFDIEDLTLALDSAIKAVNGKVKSVVFERERQKKVVSSALPEIDEAKRVQIFTEIDDETDEIGTTAQEQIYEYHLKAGLITKNELRKKMGLPKLAGAEGNELIILQEQAQSTPADALKTTGDKKE